GLIGAGGAWTLNTSSAGTTLTLNGITGSSVLSATDSTHTFGLFLTASAGVEVQFGTTSNHALSFFTNNANRIVISNAGAWSGSAPAAAITPYPSTAGATSRAAVFAAPNTASQSFGVRITAGTNSGDDALRVQNAPGAVDYFMVRGDGAISGFGPVA